MPEPKAFIEVELLPAGHGDGLLVRYGQKGQVARMLIDGGPHHTYPNLLKRLLSLPREERHFELLVITHIDCDHIDGIIRLLQEDLSGLGITFDDVWFNGAQQLNQVVSADDALGAKEGEYLQALLQHLKLPWNNAFGGGPVLARPREPFTLASGASVRVLSPTRAKLIALLQDWEEVIREAGFAKGDPAEILERLKSVRRFRALGLEPDALGSTAPASKAPDSALANGSSIAFTLEVGRQRVLFTGDAHTSVLIEALDNQLAPGKRLKLNALKVSHHGSSGNLSPALLDRIDCRHFLFSTDGRYFGHPDSLTIEMIRNAVAKPELWFNYPTEQTARWLDPDIGQGLTVHMPEGAVFHL